MMGADSGSLSEAAKLFEFSAYTKTPMHRGTMLTMPFEVFRLLTEWWNEKNMTEEQKNGQSISWRSE